MDGTPPGSVVTRDVAFANTAAIRAVDTGVSPQRAPDHVRKALNQEAQQKMLRPDNVELRFVPDGPVSVTLSCPEGETRVVPFWGPFQRERPVRVQEEPVTVTLERPAVVSKLKAEYAPSTFSPRVCRLVMAGEPVVVHGIEGSRRPPRTSELPNRRVLAYGTSITEGAVASNPHLTYAFQTARRLGADLRNLGSGGSAYCEAAIADYIASETWDAAMISISVNMVTAGFSLDEFESRAKYLLETIASGHDKPVVVVTVFPYYADICDDATDEQATAHPSAFRDSLRAVVELVSEDNVHLLEGPGLLEDVKGLSADLLHPGDFGMIEIANSVSAEIQSLLGT